MQLSKELEVSVDSILNGSEGPKVSYSKAGVDISYTDLIKNEMEEFVSKGNRRILNKMGDFASLYDFSFEDIEHPVLVLKAEKDTIKTLVKGISDACRENECVLIGGETSIQPQVVDKGIYVLTSCIAGVVDKKKIINGEKISAGDKIIAVASNGLHTNGYSLVRLLMEMFPEIKKESLDGESFIDLIMKPHTAYYPILKNILNTDGVTGMAHITGGGIEGNVKRIIPGGLCAVIDLSMIDILSIFKFIKKRGHIDDKEMLSTFNCGVGLIIIAKENFANRIINYVNSFVKCYEIGIIKENIDKEKVEFVNEFIW